MKTKSHRLTTIEKIISSNSVGSQDELLIILKKQGIITTQATLSRDLKTLKVAKQPNNNGGYIYVLPDNKLEKNNNTNVDNFFDWRVLSIEFSGNLTIIKTLPGFASGLALAIDNYDFQEIAGTVAGDDTLLVIKRENVANHQVLDSISLLIQDVNNKLIN